MSSGNKVVKKLTNKAGGNVMFSETDLNFVNEFVADSIKDIPEDKASNYRKYKEQRQKKEKKDKQLEVIAKIKNQVPDPFGRDGIVTPVDRGNVAKSNNMGNSLTGTVSAGNQKNIAALGESGKWIERKRKIFIDSQFRNIVRDPDASDFVASWGNTFQNVKSMKLVSLEFPNVVQSIRMGVNSTLEWINLEDIDLDPPFPVYTVDVNSGSYRLETLQLELTARLKVPKRHGGIVPVGEPPVRHLFIVETNYDTDYVGFTSIIAQPAGNNPVTTIAGSSTVHFKQNSHGYKDGERIHIIGVQGTVGGLQSAEINGAYNIHLIDANTFDVDIQAVAQYGQTGGGTMVRSGREAPFQFLFGQSSTPISDIIGFPRENSSVPIPEVHPLTSIIKMIVSLIPDGQYTQIVAPEHRLVPGDRIMLHNVHITPSIYENEKIRGVFTVHAVPSPDVFTVAYRTEHVSDITNAFVGTQIMEMYFPNHGFNRIVDIEQTGVNTVHITTLYDHGFDSKSKVRISESNSVPSIDGYYAVVPTDTDGFTISSSDPLQPLLLEDGGHKGILTSDHNFYLYNVTEFGGFTSYELNNTMFSIREIIDADRFIFQGNIGFSNVAETGGGGGIRINSKLHGWAGTQSNFIEDHLYRPVRLAGENYAYMCIPGLSSDSISTNSPVKDIFAKLFITADPGLVIFNEFDSSPIDFVRPIPVLNELRFIIKSPENETITFNGLDYSFGLEVVEQVPATTF